MRKVLERAGGIEQNLCTNANIFYDQRDTITVESLSTLLGDFDVAHKIGRKDYQLEPGEFPFIAYTEFLEKEGRSSVVAIDSVFNTFGARPDILHYLALLSADPNLKVLYGMHPVKGHLDHIEEIFPEDRFKIVTLSPLDRSEMQTYIERALDGTEWSVTEDAMDLLYFHTGGRPDELNESLNRILFKLSFADDYDHSRVLDCDLCLKVIGTEDFYSTISWSVFGTYSQAYKFALDGEAKAIVQKLAHLPEGADIAGQCSQEALKYLLDFGFVEIDPYTVALKIRGETFRKKMISSIHREELGQLYR